MTHDALLASWVSSKLEEGDFKGAIRVACSDDKLANMDDSRFAALQSRHPLPPYDSDFPSIERNALPAINVSETDIVKAVFSFPVGSAGGPMVFAPNISKTWLAPPGRTLNSCPLLFHLSNLCWTVGPPFLSGPTFLVLT